MHQQRSLMAAIFNEATDGLFLVNPETGLCVDCNPQAVRLLEADSRAQLIDHPAPHLQIPAPTASTAQQRQQEIQRWGYWSLEASFTTLQGNSFWGALTVKKISLSGVLIDLVRITDITARKQAEVILEGYKQQLEREVSQRTADLYASEARYRLLAENTNDLICQHEPDGRYTYVSPSVESLLGYHATELIGKNPYDFFHPDDQASIREDSHSLVLNGQASRITYRFRCKNGEYRWLETLTRPILDDNGQVSSLQTSSRDVQERVETAEKLRFDALHDSLTQLANRSLLEERLALALKRQHRCPTQQFALLFLDLDRFKLVNDSLGHQVGDQLLQAVANKLSGLIREVDLAARVSGDEFAVLLEDLSDPHEAFTVAQRIGQAFCEPFKLTQRQVSISVSIGIVFGDQRYQQGRDMLRDADIAMYQAKRRNTDYEIFDPQMHTQTLRRLTLEDDLRQALREQALELHYQPIVDLSTRVINGVEVLLRWSHPRLGAISPGEFIPIAEEVGLILDLGLWVLQQSCKEMMQRQQHCPPLAHLNVHVNLSPRQLKNPELPGQIRGILQTTGFPAARLTLELTEGMLVNHADTMLERLHALRNLGIHLSIDDFGTGYSSLSYLHRFPVTSLKIDQSFVRSLGVSRSSQEIPGAILGLGKQLGLTVVAEGIEHPEQLTQLNAMGCHLGQGYLFSKAVPGEQLVEILNAEDTARHPAQACRWDD